MEASVPGFKVFVVIGNSNSQVPFLGYVVTPRWVMNVKAISLKGGNNFLGFQNWQLSSHILFSFKSMSTEGCFLSLKK